MQSHDVNIGVPPEEMHADEITVTGTAANVESAVADILRRVVKFEEAAEDRVSLLGLYLLVFFVLQSVAHSVARGDSKVTCGRSS